MSPIHTKLNEADSNLSKNLKKILRERDISVSELARSTGLAQSTLNQLFQGVSNSPRISTLVPIAKFLNISLDTLLGISGKEEEMTFFKHIPIIEWEQIKKWFSNNNSFNLLEHKEWVITDQNFEPLSFAVKSTKPMEPLFKNNSNLIIDSSKIIQDGSYVIFSSINGNCRIKKVLKNGEDVFLERINDFDESEIIKFDDKQGKIYGYIKEVRLNL